MAMHLRHRLAVVRALQLKFPGRRMSVKAGLRIDRFVTQNCSSFRNNDRGFGSRKLAILEGSKSPGLACQYS